MYYRRLYQLPDLKWRKVKQKTQQYGVKAFSLYLINLVTILTQLPTLILSSNDKPTTILLPSWCNLSLNHLTVNSNYRLLVCFVLAKTG